MERNAPFLSSNSLRSCPSEQASCWAADCLSSVSFWDWSVRVISRESPSLSSCSRVSSAERERPFSSFDARATFSPVKSFSTASFLDCLSERALEDDSTASFISCIFFSTSPSSFLNGLSLSERSSRRDWISWSSPEVTSFSSINRFNFNPLSWSALSLDKKVFSISSSWRLLSIKRDSRFLHSCWCPLLACSMDSISSASVFISISRLSSSLLLEMIPRSALVELPPVIEPSGSKISPFRVTKRASGYFLARDRAVGRSLTTRVLSRNFFRNGR